MAPVFQENWKDFQFAVVGANGLTEIRNANQARIRGFESNLDWAATYNLVLSAGIAIYKSELTQNYCGALDANDEPVTNCPVSDAFPDGPLAPEGDATCGRSRQKVKGDITAQLHLRFLRPRGLRCRPRYSALYEGRRRAGFARR